MADSKQNNSEKMGSYNGKTCQGQWMSGEYKPGLVSVIIPTYNRADLVRRAIQSVLEQTYQDFEIIVVDDGSIDNAEEVVRSFKDDRIHFIRHKENRGGSAARNTGIKASKGQYIAFLDSDDEWLPSKTEKQLKIFLREDSKLGAVGAGRIIKFIVTDKIKTLIPSGNFGNIYRELLKGISYPGGKSWPGGTPAIMIKKECFDKVGLFDEQMKSAQEHDLYIRIAKYYHFDVVREPLVKVYIGSSHSISLNMYAQLQGKRRLLLKHSKDIPVISKLKGNYNYIIGIILCRQNEIKEGRKYLFKAVISYPLILKYWVNFLFSITPFYEYLLFKRTWLRRKN